MPKHILDAFPVGILPESDAKIVNNFQPKYGIKSDHKILIEKTVII